MGKYCATSDVKCIVGADLSPLSAGLTSNALPEVQKPIKPTNSQTGVSTNDGVSGFFRLVTPYVRNKVLPACT